MTRVTRDTRVAVLCRRSGQEILDPREFMKRARDEMGAQSVEAHRAANPPPGWPTLTLTLTLTQPQP